MPRLMNNHLPHSCSDISLHRSVQLYKHLSSTWFWNNGTKVFKLPSKTFLELSTMRAWTWVTASCDSLLAFRLRVTTYRGYCRYYEPAYIQKLTWCISNELHPWHLPEFDYPITVQVFFEELSGTYLDNCQYSCSLPLETSNFTKLQQSTQQTIQLRCCIYLFEQVIDIPDPSFFLWQQLPCHLPNRMHCSRSSPSWLRSSQYHWESVACMAHTSLAIGWELFYVEFVWSSERVCFLQGMKQPAVSLAYNASLGR